MMSKPYTTALLRLAESRTTQMLQRVPTTRPAQVRDLYWRAYSAIDGMLASWDLRADGSIAIARNTLLNFDTYFAAFFEMPWRLHTRLDGLALRLKVEGRPLLRIFRRVCGQICLLHESVPDGDGLIALPAGLSNFREHGVLFFEIVARDAPAVFHEACWVSLAPTPAINLAVVICTFNRAREIAAVLAALAQDTPVLDRLSRIIVVNQGAPGLIRSAAIRPVAAALGDRLIVIDQDNFGGAGGFTRGLLTAMDDPTLDHVVFLDDDIRIEPDSLLRMSAFFALAREDAPVGGQMLDGVQPTRLYEAGAVIGERHWTFEPEHSDLDLADATNLERLTEPRPIHYNGWWCFGFPLRLVQRVGLPMPCFIRGDDTEFGLRLYFAGIPTLSVPGIAVWHEPFYLKLDGWQLYYETRNTLVTMAVHRSFSRLAVARRMARQILIHMMTYRYLGTALIVRGIADYLSGPNILHDPPQALHEDVLALRARYASGGVRRSTIIAPLAIPPMPRRRIGFLFALLRAIRRNYVQPTSAMAEPQRVAVHDFSWVTVANADCVALERWWDRELPRLSRSREHFRELAPRVGAVLLALFRHGPEAARRWREGHATLTSVPFWRTYLGLNHQRTLPELTESDALTSLCSPMSGD